MKPSDFSLIFAYTRKQAIDDGVLVDVTKPAREAGFVIPVAVTASLWAECVRVPEGVSGQDEAGRLWDVLCLLRWAARNNGGHEVRYSLHVYDSPDEAPRLVTLRAVCGPDDDVSPCITVMLDGED